MKHKLKIISFFLVVVLMFTALVACVQPSSGGNNGDNDKGIEVTVSFDLNYQGAPQAPEDIIVEVGKRYGQLPETTRANYTFEGWYLNKTNFTTLNKVDSDTEVINDLDHVLYAKWKGISVTVNYDLKGGKFNGESTIDSETVEFGSPYGMGIPSGALEHPDPSLTFLYWYIETADGEVVVTEETIVSINQEHTLCAMFAIPQTVWYGSDSENIDLFTFYPHYILEGVYDGDGVHGGASFNYDEDEKCLKLTVHDNRVQTLGIRFDIPIEEGDVIVWTVDVVLPSGGTLSAPILFRTVADQNNDWIWTYSNEQKIGEAGDTGLTGVEIDSKIATTSYTGCLLWICSWGYDSEVSQQFGTLHTTLKDTVYYIRKIEIFNSADLLTKTNYDFTNPMDKSLISIQGVNPLDGNQSTGSVIMEFDKTENCLKLSINGSNVASIDLKFSRPLNVGEKIKWTVDVVLPDGETLTGPVIFRPIDDDWGWTIAGDTWLGTAGDSEVIGGIVESKAAPDNNSFTILEIVSWGDFPAAPAYDAHTTVAGTVYYIRSVEIIPAAE